MFKMVFDLHSASETITGRWNSIQTILPKQIMTVQMDASQVAQLTDNVTMLLSMAVNSGMWVLRVNR